MRERDASAVINAEDDPGFWTPSPSSAQRLNIFLNASRALANLAARSLAVTAVVKSMIFMSLFPRTSMLHAIYAAVKDARASGPASLHLILSRTAIPFAPTRFPAKNLSGSPAS